MYSQLKSSQNGVAVLLAIVVVGALSLLLVKGLSFLSLNNLSMSVLINNGEIAKNNAIFCQENALRRLLSDGDWQGSFEMELDKGECEAAVSGEPVISIASSGSYEKYNFSDTIKVRIEENKLEKYYE